MADERTRLESELDALALILVDVAVLVLVLALVLERDDDKADEYVEHEEGDDDYVREKEYGDRLAVIVDGTFVLLCRVDRFVQEPSRDRAQALNIELRVKYIDKQQK